MSSNKHIYHAAFNVAEDRGPNMAKTWQNHDQTKKKRKRPSCPYSEFDIDMSKQSIK